MHRISNFIRGFQKDTSIRKILKNYRSLRIKVRKISLDIDYISNCRRTDVIPKFISNSFKGYKGNKKLKIKLMKTALKFEMDEKYKLRDDIYKKLMYLQLELLHRLHPLEFQTFDSQVEIIIQKEIGGRKHRQNQKLLKLMDLKPDNDQVVQKFNPKFVNLSDVIFTQREQELLNRGMKYCPPTSNPAKEIENLVIDVNCKVYDKLTVQSTCHSIENYIKNLDPNTKNPENHTLHQIKKKVKNNDLVVTKADKSNAIVFLPRPLYHTKVADFLTQGDITICNQDPTVRINTELRQLLKETQLLENPEKLINMNPRPPKFHGYVKTHKVTQEVNIKQVPIRPVVATYSSPTYKTEKFLAKLFRRHTSWKPTYGIKNSTELASQLQGLKLPHNAKLVSLDVDNLFTNVDVKEANHLACEILKNHSNLSRGELKNFKVLLDFVTNNNYFQYQDDIFKLTDGLPMGAPTSPLLADIFMHKYDNMIVSLEKWNRKILKYVRFVDDVYLIWTGSNRELDQFLKDINKLKKNLTFKLELGDKELNFLDLKTRILDQKIVFEIYRKDSYTDAIIPQNSNHSEQHKMASFHCLLNRLLSIPLSEKAYNRELTTILQIATNNGYTKKLILTMLRKKKTNMENKLLYKSKGKGKKEKWIAIPYVPNLSDEIKKVIQKSGDCEVTYCNKPNIGNLLKNTHITNSDPLQNSGIYKVTCSCNKFYIGQTGRSVDIRTKEHFSHARLHKEGGSSLSDHLISTEHKAEDCEIEVIQKCGKGRKMNMLEQFEIERHKGGQLLNTQLESQSATLALPPSLFRLNRPAAPPDHQSQCRVIS